MSTVIRGLMGSFRGFYPSFNASQRSILNEKISRQSFSGIVQSSPSQLPGPGESGWSRFLANREQDKAQPPISPAELRQGQLLLELEQCIAQMEKILSKIKNVVEGIPDPKTPFQKSRTQ